MARKKNGSPVKTTKRGALSAQEKGTIAKLAGKQSYEQIAGVLNRPLAAVTNYVEKMKTTDEEIQPQSEVSLSLEMELKQRPEWTKFQSQFTDLELNFFVYRYIRLMDQFGREEVLGTEEMQVFNLITLEILMDRNMNEQKVNNTLMLDLQAKIEEASQYPSVSQEDVEYLMELNVQYDTARAGAKSASDRYKTLSDKQSATFKELKSTRDQRVKSFEGPANSFLGLLKQLNQADFARKAGREAELMKLASLKELERLSKPHKFEDGVVDQPILTARTLIDDYEDVKALPSPKKGEDDD